MFSQYLPWLSDAAWENAISPVRRRKTSNPRLPRYWSSRKEPPEATTCKMVVLKQQHLGFGPKKHAGINTSERWQSCMGRSCRNREIIGEKYVCVDRGRQDGEWLGTCISCGFIVILAYKLWTAALQLLRSWLSWHYLQTLLVLRYRGLSPNLNKEKFGSVMYSSCASLKSSSDSVLLSPGSCLFLPIWLCQTPQLNPVPC